MIVFSKNLKAGGGFKIGKMRFWARLFLLFIKIAALSALGCLSTALAGPIINVRPAYPEQVLEECLEGFVVLRFVAEEDLQDADIEVVESSPEGVFDKAAKVNLKRSISEFIKNGNQGKELTEKFTFQIKDDCAPNKS